MFAQPYHESDTSWPFSRREEHWKLRKKGFGGDAAGEERLRTCMRALRRPWVPPLTATCHFGERKSRSTGRGRNTRKKREAQCWEVESGTDCSRQSLWPFPVHTSSIIRQLKRSGGGGWRGRSEGRLLWSSVSLSSSELLLARLKRPTRTRLALLPPHRLPASPSSSSLRLLSAVLLTSTAHPPDSLRRVLIAQDSSAEGTAWLVPAQQADLGLVISPDACPRSRFHFPGPAGSESHAQDALASTPSVDKQAD